jgi:hypothetical protein
VLSIATFDADVTLGDSPTDALTLNGTLTGATPLSFEGATSDVNETSFAITDPTADRTITFPDASGTVALVGGISTDATLTGDGSSGSPLGIDVTNANSWTGAQTFSSVDINGGTIDGTSLGATTPSSGAFTTLSASGSTSLGDGDAGDAVTVNNGAGTDLTVSEGGVDRSNAATQTFSIDNSGAGAVNVLINGATSVTNSRIAVDDGHWTSQQTTAPAAAVAGANVTSAVLSNETDVAGLIDITTSGTPASGAQATVTFDAAYGTAPVVVLTAANGAAAGVGAYVTRTTTTFTVNFIGVPAASTSYQFYYQVIETQ